MLKTDCVFYTGATTSCLGITSNTNLSSIIRTLDAAICAISPSGQFNVIVSGVSGQTTVSSSTIGQTIYYTVGLSPNITGQISTLNSQVATINTFIAGATDTITSSSLTVTQPSAHVWNIEGGAIPGTTCNGIIYTDFVKHGTALSSTPIDVTIDFTNSPCPDVQLGDRIVYRIAGSYTKGFPLASEFTISVMNGSSTIKTRVGDANTIDPIDNSTAAFFVELTIFVTGTTTGIMNCVWNDTYFAAQNATSNYGITQDSTKKQTIGMTLTSVDYSALRTKIDLTAGTGSNFNFINLFTAEIIKKY